MRKKDEELNQAAVQMRGLPYRATVKDIQDFLGVHAEGLKDRHSSVQLVLNRDGRPSGFARVQFSSPDVAKAARDDLHMRVMEIAPAGNATDAAPDQEPGQTVAALPEQRYVEIFLYSERPNKLRFKKTV